MRDSIACRWQGGCVVVAGSGPSLSAADVALVGESGLPLLVCNSTWQMAPWAAALVAMDTAWWQQCGPAASAGFQGLRIGFSATSLKFGAQYAMQSALLHNFGNSGAFAIAVAVRGGARRIVLIGFDGGPSVRGELHWHGEHPAPLKNPQWSALNTWPKQFARVADHARKAGSSIVNASRSTRITCFDRQELEAVLASESSTSSTSATSGGSRPAPPPGAMDTRPRASTAAAR